MFCPECGSNIEGEPKFCPSCGTELAYIEVEESEGNTSASQPETELVSFESASDGASGFNGATLKDSVRFAKGLTNPVTDLPQKQPSGNELLDDLERFTDVYHVYTENCVRLLKVAQEKDALERAGYTWYYSNSDDAVIQASRQISSEISDSQKALKSTRSSLKENKRKRAQATEKRDEVKSESQRKVDKAGKKAKRRTGCLVVLVVYVIGASLLLVTQNPSVAAQMGQEGGTLSFIGGIAFCILPLIYIFIKVRAKKKTTEKAAGMANEKADARFRSTIGQLAKSDADLEKQATDLESKIDALVPIAQEIKQKAMERSEFLYDTEMVDLSELMTLYSEAINAQHDVLASMGTIPDEDEWYEADRITKLVRSGRADTMKEALQLLDTTNYRDKDLGLKQQMVEGQQMTNAILGVGFTEVLRKQQEMLDVQRSAFSEMQEKMDVQHAQSMLAQAAQIKKQSEIIQKQSEQNSHLESISSNAAKQSEFNEEVRDRFNWTDQNRPDRDYHDEASVGRNNPWL